MTEIVMKPDHAAQTVGGKNLYVAVMNRKPTGLRVRARNAGEADAMFQYLFENQTAGKTLDFDLKGLIECREESNEEGKDGSAEEAGKSEDTEGH